MRLSVHLFIFFLLANCSIFFVKAQKQYKVGGDEGWRVPDNSNPDFYTAWASKLRFQVGDTIVFEYKNDSVIRVEKRGYYHCNESSNGALYKDGSTVFVLDKPGLLYFVSSNIEHCKMGQRLMVDVMASHGPPFSGAPGPSPHSSATAGNGGFLPLLVVAFGTFLV
ncbi:mavicyanin-like [Phalaenopsis equestris]|uniref:mavicyanin-like n=1 Tax=Phalaenopsis equestris TaxID=78828 RepID=UPI0009E1E9A8|nr:mavicyanin-like [Phalaenopsis equestris]